MTATISRALVQGAVTFFPRQNVSHSVSQINHSILISETVKTLESFLLIGSNLSPGAARETARKRHQQRLKKYFVNLIWYKIDVCKIQDGQLEV